MNYLIAWDMRLKKPKHLGTVIVSNNYLVVYDENIKKGMTSIVKYETVNNKLRAIPNSRSIIKLPNDLIRFEVLTEEEFDLKYNDGLEMKYKS